METCRTSLRLTGETICITSSSACHYTVPYYNGYLPVATTSCNSVFFPRPQEDEMPVITESDLYGFAVDVSGP